MSYTNGQITDDNTTVTYNSHSNHPESKAIAPAAITQEHSELG